MLRIPRTVPSLPRPTVLLVSGLLALGTAAPALAQSAGDEQYSDPLAGQSSPKPSQSSKSSSPSLTPAPQGSSAGSGSSGSGAGSAAPAPTPAPAPSSPSAAAPAASSSARQLPRTGFDTMTVAALGGALLLLGIGLRLRTADARF